MRTYLVSNISIKALNNAQFVFFGAIREEFGAHFDWNMNYYSFWYKHVHLQKNKDDKPNFLPLIYLIPPVSFFQDKRPSLHILNSEAKIILGKNSILSSPSPCF